MTRFLSESLQASEPTFRHGIHRLETANGHPSNDIRLTAEVKQASQAKLRELGLDPNDTTAEELYHVLQERIQSDDAKLVRRLRTQAATHVSAEGEIVDGMIHELCLLPESRRCFALKTSVLRSLIRKQPPKKAMKQLGYRSLDSFLKHESPITAVAAAWLTEGDNWQHKLLDQYKKLSPSDFEERSILMVQPNTKRWRELATKVVDEHRHNLVTFKELGALVFLPLPMQIPAGTTTVSMCLALRELNDIRATSAYLKLCLVRSDFGKVVQSVAIDEPHLSSDVLNRPVPWNLIQRFYARMTSHLQDEVFEPHLQLEDMTWHPIERALSAIEPAFEFWHDSSHLGLLHDGKPVSMNVVDSALNLCNKLPFEQRVVHYFQRSLWHELLLRYLQHEAVEQTVLRELQPEFALQKAMA